LTVVFLPHLASQSFPYHVFIIAHKRVQYILMKCNSLLHLCYIYWHPFADRTYYWYAYES